MRAKKVADQLGDNAIFIQQDVARKGDWDRVIRQTVQVFGKLNIVVNNAGIAEYADVEKQTQKFGIKQLQLTLLVRCGELSLVLKQ